MGFLTKTEAPTPIKSFRIAADVPAAAIESRGDTHGLAGPLRR
jgi:hypothetical protein